MVSEAAKFAYPNKEGFITSQKLGSPDFRQIANSVVNKGNLHISPLFNSLEGLSSASDKDKLCAENFSKNSDETKVSFPVSLYLFSLLELI